MADNTVIRYSGDWVFHNGAVAAGALLYVYDAGTSSLSSIYTDNDLTTASANPVTADASGLMPFAFIGTTEYKVKLTTSGGTTIDEQDNITGAFDSTPFLAGTFAKPDQDFTSRTANYTVLSGDLGGIINGDPTGGAFDFTLISAVTATNGKGVTLRHVGTANTIGIVTVSSQTITSPTTGVTTTSFELIGYGESVTLESDGSNWHVTRYVPPLLRPNTPGVIKIADRVSAAPASSPGTRYIVAAAFDTFEQEDIVEDDGQGGLIEITPPTDCGWVAYVQDEDSLYQFVGSAWVQLAANINALTEDTAPVSADDFVATYDASASTHKKVKVGSVGTIIQRTYSEYTSTTTHTTLLPADGTIPQITEGTEIISQAITLKKATNRVRARFVAPAFQANTASSGNCGAALFIAGTSNALNATHFTIDGETTTLAMDFEHAPGAVGPHTYSVRVGPATGGAMIVNNSAYGGATRATLILEEISV